MNSVELDEGLKDRRHPIIQHYSFEYEMEFEFQRMILDSSLNTGHPHVYWRVPKKMHKLIHWVGSFKMLLGAGAADYLIMRRNPLPTAISNYEKAVARLMTACFPPTTPAAGI